jgi:hypothetical protein
MERPGRGVRVVGWVLVVVGIVFALAGAVTWYLVGDQLAAEKITVSEDARFLAGRDVTGPFTAYAQADVINKHAVEATGGKTYAELGKDDPLRQTAMQASFLRASLYTSVVAFGVAAMAVVVGVVLVLVGAALRSLAAGVVAAPSRLPSHA